MKYSKEEVLTNLNQSSLLYLRLIQRLKKDILQD